MPYQHSPNYTYYTAIVYDMGASPIKIKRVRGYCSLANAIAEAEVGMAIIEKVKGDWVLNRIINERPKLQRKATSNLPVLITGRSMVYHPAD